MPVAEKRRRAVEMRSQGYTLAQIGAELKCSGEVARKYIHQALEHLNSQSDGFAEEHRRMTLFRLDAAVKALWPRIEMGDPMAVAALVKIEERRARITGMDAPKRSEKEVYFHGLPEVRLREIAERMGLALSLPPAPTLPGGDFPPDALPGVEVIDGELVEADSGPDPFELLPGAQEQGPHAE